MSNDILVLKAGSFRVEKGSVLHEGIYNREFISSLAAATLGGVVVFGLAILFDLGIMNYIVGGAVFVISFPVLRAYVFRETFLTTEINRAKGEVTLLLRKTIGTELTRKPIEKLEDIHLRHTKIEVENPDAVEFVEKISLQHGTVIPGFGEAEELYSVELVFDGRETSVFVSKDREKTEKLVKEMRDFAFSH